VANGKLHPTLPFGVPAGGRFGSDAPAPGVRARLLAGHRLVLVMPMRGAGPSVSAKLEATFGLGLPPAGRAHANERLSLSWAGAGAWLAGAPEAGLAASLSAALGDAAAVVDQTDGRCLFRLGGDAVRQTLAKGTTLDLDPQAFASGHAAVTLLAHLAAGIRQCSDAPEYEITVPRSSAGDFWHWLVESASEHGLGLDVDDA